MCLIRIQPGIYRWAGGTPGSTSRPTEPYGAAASHLTVVRASHAVRPAQAPGGRGAVAQLFPNGMRVTTSSPTSNAAQPLTEKLHSSAAS